MPVTTKKKSRKKLFTIAALLVLGVVAVLGYQMFMGGGEEGANPRLTSELGYVGLDPFLAPVIEGRRISRYVAVGVILELYDKNDKAKIYKNITPLRNAFIDDFAFQAQMNSANAETLHLRRIKSRFLTLAERIVGPNIVREVLISHALDRGF